MIASQTVFLTEDRSQAVPEGDPRAKFKLVHKGQEIPDAEVAKYQGAADLIGAKAKATKLALAPEKEAPAVQNREDDTHGKLHKRGK